MKAGLSITLQHCGSDKEYRSSSKNSGSGNNNDGSSSNNNGNDSVFNGNKKSGLEYSVQCSKPRGSDEILEQLHFYEIYPH